ncbi:hypothetical protein [Bradyrhizobium sp. NP1]|uniref:hypothetical protein n=1 Tax=Bradyrhizobium sp. NP1 TaxID=3049772 RepID=UPI0025A5DBB0|nr:hypothetical protein [Bradyrhizobium sp. NP1]WJR77724.1 hypothetical protein QOU61_34300 [Bradyrhizobium sp. NP1]
MFSSWLAAALIFLLIGGVLWALLRANSAARVDGKEASTFANKFVYVNDDGSVRELTADEKTYLNTRFHPIDGARPYVKGSYRQKSPDGRISGYLLKRRLPRRMRPD